MMSGIRVYFDRTDGPAVMRAGCCLSAAGACLLVLALHGCSATSATDSTCVSAEATELRQQVAKRARELDYGPETATALAEMVLGWRRGGTPVLVGCKAVLDRVSSQTPQAIARAQMQVVERIAWRMGAEFTPDKEVFEPTEVVERKRANCLGYAQLLYIIGRSVGLAIEPAGVLELQKPGPLPEGSRHLCCLVALSDGTTAMLSFAPGFISTPFVLERTYTRSGCYLWLKDIENPPNIYRKIQCLDGDGLVAHLCNSRGAALAAQGRFRAALEHYAKATELSPQLAEAWNNRGVALRHCGALDEALAAYDRAIELDGSYAEAFNNRALTRAKSGWLTDALHDYDRAVELNPRSASVRNNLAAAYHRLGRLNEAISQYSRAIALNPNLTAAYFNRANAYGKLGEHRLAVRDYTRAIQCNGGLEQAYINRGLSHAALGRYDEAKRDLQQAIKLSPTTVTREQVSSISQRVGLDRQTTAGAAW